ncbi:MAG: leucyl aminopeptidase [Actinobacteria bacterium]|nr:leucyl aminopeptidase [Actinomycetota bacterium]
MAGAPDVDACDTHALLVAGAALQAEGPRAAQALLATGEARDELGHVAVLHEDGRRWLLVGAGAESSPTAESARRAAAAGVERAAELRARRLCWHLPSASADAVRGVVDGAAFAAYRYVELKTSRDAPAPEVVLSVADAHRELVRETALVADAACRARDLQNRPPDRLTPTTLAEHACTLDGLDVTVYDADQLTAMGAHALVSVGAGSAEPTKMIVARYTPGASVAGPVAFVGKGVTYDSGGLFLKDESSLPSMKYDMSGAAVVLEATAAIAELGLPIEVIAVLGAAENMPDGAATRPSQVVSTMDGTTVEVVDTDAEGRLVLADCITHAVRLGATHVIDVATLTGSVVMALAHSYAGLIANDDGWAAAIEAAGQAAGEELWRLPLHDDYETLLASPVADIVNFVPKIGGVVTAGQFLSRFAKDVPWAHVDMTGTAFDWGRPYARAGGSGYGVRLLVELARTIAGRV